MKKVTKYLVLLTLTIIVFCIILPDTQTDAHLGRKHDSILEEFLFHNKSGIKNKELIKYLEKASYLMIDQFGSDGQDKLDDLLSWGVKHIEKKVSVISNGNAGGSAHRKYTHRGWLLKYYEDMSISDYKIVKQKFSLRKDILVNTANKLFKFRNDKQADAFCQLVYYIHIFADHDAAFLNKPDRINEVESNESDREIMCLISMYNNEDVVNNLLNCLKTLFVNQSSRGQYISMVSATTDIYNKMKNLKYYDGSVTEENKQEYRELFLQMQDILWSCIPDLLERENFFAEVFY